METINDNPTARPMTADEIEAAKCWRLEPSIRLAVETDKAIRVADGRYSLGFVDVNALKEAIARGLLVTEQRNGMAFAILPK